MLNDANMDSDAEPPETSNEVSKNKNNSTSGIARYITITKRKRSPTTLTINNNPKTKVTKSEGSQNQFDILSIDDDELGKKDSPPLALPKFRPPPIYLREVSSKVLISDLDNCVGKNNFYIVDLKRGQLKETKIQASEEMHYCSIVNLLERKKKNFYTYQLKSAKGLKVVIKGIDSNVDTEDIKNDLEEKGFKIKSVNKIINRLKVPQPMFKIELTPEGSKAPKGKIHPIYEIRYVLHRKITVEEPHKPNSLAQCQNCQEFGHTKTYCQLTSVCVACGGKHITKNCPLDKADSNTKKCSNCNGNHTANYRGCPVYVHIYNSTKPQNRPRIHPPVTDPSHQQYSQYSPPPPPIITQSNYNLSYADVTKNQPPQFNQQNFNNQDNLTQMLLLLVNNMQQLTSTIQEMQKTLTAQNALLIKLASP